jgi:hypothetical protein
LVLGAGHYFGTVEWQQYRAGDRDRYIRWPLDDFGSQYWIFRGARDANRKYNAGVWAKVDDIILGYAVWDRNIMRHLDYFRYNEY